MSERPTIAPPIDAPRPPVQPAHADLNRYRCVPAWTPLSERAKALAAGRAS